MFIVLEGLDGAGKSTQIRLLEQWLREQGKMVEYLHFPRFDTPVYGELIARFLRGELGAVETVDPWLVALIYAGDRAAAAPVIRRWLREEKTVIVDRYVASNIAYQCAKVAGEAKKTALRDWIRALEYDTHAIPSPDLTLFLDVPFAFTERSLSGARSGGDRDYLQGKADIHERSLALQQAVRQAYLTEAALDPAFRVVDCSDGGENILPPAPIFDRIQEILTSYEPVQ
jgi:dTMP kinase